MTGSSQIIKKMSYKYKDNFKEFLSDLESLFYTKLPLKDFDGNPIVYIESRADINNNIVKTLSHSQNTVQKSNIK